MKYLVVLILIGIGIYLFYRIRNGGLPDINDVKHPDYNENEEKNA